MFSNTDLEQIEKHTLDKKTIEYQVEKFKAGFPSTILNQATSVGNGILKLDQSQVDRFVHLYQNLSSGAKVIKFVPASGAATRMFKALYEFLHTYQGTDEDYQKLISDQSSGSVFTFFKRLEDFAFYADLKKKFESLENESLEEAQIKKKYTRILEVLLEDEGLGYGNLPKALLKFHSYGQATRTPVEEHLVEGAEYARTKRNQVYVHFTVSPEHMDRFKSHVQEVRGLYEGKYGVTFTISYSIQKPSTDTLAVTMNNEPFRDEDGRLLFRPAGHGALLENLNDLDGDIVFIKNIDNVVPDALKDETILYKKVIAGVLLHYQTKSKAAINKLKEGKERESAENLLGDHLGYRMGEAYQQMSESEKINTLIAKLNRPLRVCGVVRSEGDPGGGPFWVKEADGSVSLQIVETAQIDLDNPEQKGIFSQSTHFNPVDVVFSPLSSDGKKIDLMKHRDPETGFITKKSKDGKDLKAQELPGLWNGSMADWNTVFVEVPAITFNPVKSVNDLLKKEHQI